MGSFHTGKTDVQLSSEHLATLWSVVTTPTAPVQPMTHSRTCPVRETLNSPTKAVYASFLEAAERFSGRRVIIFGKLLLAARGLGGRVRQEDPPPHQRLSLSFLGVFAQPCEMPCIHSSF